MKINCELPNALLEYNNDLNEYDFVLFHLYKSNSLYRSYYKTQRILHQDRLMIFDNSAYEFYIKGENLNLKEFSEAIDDLKPDYYILPDKLMDSEYTINEVKNFLEFHKPLNNKSKPMGVLQGDSPSSLLSCIPIYKELSIEAIAIPFHLKFYIEHISNQCDIYNDFEENFEILTLDHKYAIGRVQFLRNYGELLKDFKHIHILGSHCPMEKIYYNDFQTMDTGYPVKCGVVGYKLFEEPSKPNIIIDDFMDEEFSTCTKDLIISNVETFRLL